MTEEDNILLINVFVCIVTYLTIALVVIWRDQKNGDR